MSIKKTDIPAKDRSIASEVTENNNISAKVDKVGRFTRAISALISSFGKLIPAQKESDNINKNKNTQLYGMLTPEKQAFYSSIYKSYISELQAEGIIAIDQKLNSHSSNKSKDSYNTLTVEDTKQLLSTTNVSNTFISFPTEIKKFDNFLETDNFLIDRDIKVATNHNLRSFVDGTPFDSNDSEDKLILEQYARDCEELENKDREANKGNSKPSNKIIKYPPKPLPSKALKMNDFLTEFDQAIIYVEDDTIDPVVEFTPIGTRRNIGDYSNFNSLSTSVSKSQKELEAKIIEKLELIELGEKVDVSSFIPELKEAGVDLKPLQSQIKINNQVRDKLKQVSQTHERLKNTDLEKTIDDYISQINIENSDSFDQYRSQVDIKKLMGEIGLSNEDISFYPNDRDQYNLTLSKFIFSKMVTSFENLSRKNSHKK